jgi:hypothetical protein
MSRRLCVLHHARFWMSSSLPSAVNRSSLFSRANRSFQDMRLFRATGPESPRLEALGK